MTLIIGVSFPQFLVNLTYAWAFMFQMLPAVIDRLLHSVCNVSHARLLHLLLWGYIDIRKSTSQMKEPTFLI